MINHRHFAIRSAKMPQYRHQEAWGRPDDITVIEDIKMVIKDEDGSLRPGFAFIDAYTVRAHPRIIDVLVHDAERLWTLDELMAEPS
jgi:hypothetical protein